MNSQNSNHQGLRVIGISELEMVIVTILGNSETAVVGEKQIEKNGFQTMWRKQSLDKKVSERERQRENTLGLF